MLARVQAALLIVGGGCCDRRSVRPAGAGWPLPTRAWSGAQPRRGNGGDRRPSSPARCPQAELPAHYAAGDVFAMPCRTRRGGLDVEGLGIVYLEASAAGLPVVGGDSGGAPDAILEGETGYVVGGRDVRPWPDRLIALLLDPAHAKAMGEKGRAWVERDWNWDLRRLPAARPHRRLTGSACRRSYGSQRGASISAANSLASTARLMPSLADRCPCSWVKSPSSIRNFLIDSARETALFASSTAAWTSAFRSGSSRRSATVASAGLPCLRLPRPERLGVDGDEHPDERPPVADHHALRDQRVHPHPVLEHGGRDVLAARGDDDLLLPAGDGQEALVVELADVAGARTSRRR